MSLALKLLLRNSARIYAFKMLFRVVTLFTLSTNITGCDRLDELAGKNDEENSSNDEIQRDDSSPEENTVTELEGTWNTNCLPDTSDKEASIQLSLVFTGDQNKAISFIHSNRDCSSLAFVDTKYRTFKIGNALEESLSDSARTIDITLNRVTRTYHQSEGEFGVSQAVDDSAFGHKDWQVEAEKDVTGEGYTPGAEPLGQAGEVLYQIFQIVNDSVLKLGDPRTGDSTSEAQRPNVILDSETLFFSKQ